MARPLQYQSQYVPTDFGAVSQLANLYGRDITAQNQMYEQALATQNRALAEIYGQETLDPEVFQQAGDVLSQKIQEAVKARGMDYGAAAPDISRLVAQEMRNPIYNLNKRKLEQSKLLEQALARNPNLMVLQDPRAMALSQQGLTPEDIQYGVLDPSQVEQAVTDIYGDLAKQQREGTPVFDPRSGYNVATTTLGLTPQEVAQMQADEGTYEQVLSRFPQLANYMDDPRVMEQVRERIGTGIAGLERGQRRQFLRPLEQITDSGKLSKQSAIGSLYTPSAQVEPRIYRNAVKTQEDVSNLVNEAGMVEEPKEKTVKVYRPQFPGTFADTDVELRTKEKKAYDKFKQYTDDYSVLYNKTKNLGGTDADFLSTVTQIEKDKAYVLESRIGFNDPKFTEYLTENLAFNDAQMYEVNDEGKTTNKDISWAKYNEKFKDTGLNYKDSKVFMTPKGGVILQDPAGKQYQVNPTSFPTVTRKYLETIEDVFDTFYDYSLDEEGVAKLNDPKAWFNLGAKVYAKVVVPENDVMNKKVVISFPDASTGQQVMRDDLSIDQFYGYMSKLINADVFKGK